MGTTESKPNSQCDDYQQIKNDLKLLAVLGNIGTITFRSVMGTEEEELCKKSYPVGPDGKKLKPCCACPETKRARDACVLEKGQENCSDEIEAHKACMRSMGFNI